MSSSESFVAVNNMGDYMYVIEVLRETKELRKRLCSKENYPIPAETERPPDPQLQEAWQGGPLERLILFVRLVIAGGFSWRSALLEERSNCHAAHQNLLHYKENHKVQKFLHWTLQWIGMEDIVGYDEPDLTACEGPMMTLMNSFFSADDKDGTSLDGIPEVAIDWTEITLLLCTMILTVLMIRKILRRLCIV